MGWREEILDDKKTITIRFGSGEKMEGILFKNPSVDHNYNAVAIEYYNIDGAEVQRGKEAQRVIPIELYFQGDDCFKKARDFMDLAKDTRSWIVTHPYFKEDINCQPVNLKEDYSSVNVVVITGVLWESIKITNEQYFDVKDGKAHQDVQDAITKGVESWEAKQPSGSEAAKMGEAAQKTAANNKKGVFTDIDMAYMNASINKLNASLNTIGSEPIRFMRQAARIFRAPAMFYDTIQTRVNLMKNAFNDLVLSMKGAASITENLFMETAGSFLIMGMGEATLRTKNDIGRIQDVRNPNTNEYIKVEDELQTRGKVLQTAIELNEYYNRYVDELMARQSKKDNKLDSYYPDASAFAAVNKAMSTITANLYSIAAKSKVEYSYVLKEDTPILVLTNKLLGTYNDEDVRRFKEQNNLGMNDIIMVPEGKEVIYYR